MYSTNPVVQQLMESRSRTVEWGGTIELTDGTEKDFNKSDIVQGSGSLNLSCAPADVISWGNAYLGEFALSLKGFEAERPLLQGAVINPFVRVSSTKSLTWDEASAMTWDDMAEFTWDSLRLSVPVPMGVYKIQEVLRSYGSIKITAYDNMHEFDQPFTADTTARTAYGWLVLACTTCGVTFGMTESKIYGMPNGRRLVKYANSDTSIKTWRDMISAICAMIGGNACMSRGGELVIRQYTNILADVIDASNRYSSDFSDFNSYYTGLKLSYREGNIQEYISNDDDNDTGLAFDLGYNPFMQIDNQETREDMMQALIDRQKGLVYTPFSITTPFNPLYDLMDTLCFTGNQADNAIAPITNITMRIGAEMTLSCGGENPALATAESRETKALESMSSSGSYGEDLWMVMGNAPSADSVTVAANTDTQIGEALLYAKEANSIVQIAYTATYVLSSTALVIGKLYVDSTLVYTVKQNQLVGENKLTITTGYQFAGMGSHTVKAYIRVEETTIPEEENNGE